jgi:hypothetical protein
VAPSAFTASHNKGSLLGIDVNGGPVIIFEITSNKKHVVELGDLIDVGYDNPRTSFVGNPSRSGGKY